eukprot:529966-Pyramimonas_sp.AAC.1
MCLKRGPNDWRRFVVADTAGIQQGLHIGPDKSQAQVRTEIALKAVKRAFIQTFPQKEVFINKHRGELSHQWKPILR